ncbi:MAG: BON domain-containing protein [Proteobacteria bacterium]|nr:BON domain-containing protein [Pseudomonadota bacterium]
MNRFVLAFAGLAGLALSACGAPPGVSTIARLATEDRTASQITEDNRILIAFNRAVVGESGALFREVSTDVYLGRMMLTGAVPAAPAKVRAVQIARTIEGVHEVVDELQVTSAGGIGATAADLVIEQKIGAKLLAESGIKSVNFRWRAVNGVAYLFGRAHGQAELDKAIALVRATDDVKRVVNHVRVQP